MSNQHMNRVKYKTKNQNKTIHTYSMYMSGHDLIKENNNKIPAKRNTFHQSINMYTHVGANARKRRHQTRFFYRMSATNVNAFLRINDVIIQFILPLSAIINTQICPAFLS